MLYSGVASTSKVKQDMLTDLQIECMHATLLHRGRGHLTDPSVETGRPGSSLDFNTVMSYVAFRRVARRKVPHAEGPT